MTEVPMVSVELPIALAEAIEEAVDAGRSICIERPDGSYRRWYAEPQEQPENQPTVAENPGFAKRLWLGIAAYNP